MAIYKIKCLIKNLTEKQHSLLLEIEKPEEQNNDVTQSIIRVERNFFMRIIDNEKTQEDINVFLKDYINELYQFRNTYETYLEISNTLYNKNDDTMIEILCSLKIIFFYIKKNKRIKNKNTTTNILDLFLQIINLEIFNLISKKLKEISTKPEEEEEKMIFQGLFNEEKALLLKENFLQNLNNCTLNEKERFNKFYDIFKKCIESLLLNVEDNKLLLNNEFTKKNDQNQCLYYDLFKYLNLGLQNLQNLIEVAKNLEQENLNLLKNTMPNEVVNNFTDITQKFVSKYSDKYSDFLFKTFINSKNAIKNNSIDNVDLNDNCINTIKFIIDNYNLLENEQKKLIDLFKKLQKINNDQYETINNKNIRQSPPLSEIIKYLELNFEIIKKAYNKEEYQTQESRISKISDLLSSLKNIASSLLENENKQNLKESSELDTLLNDIFNALYILTNNCYKSFMDNEKNNYENNYYKLEKEIIDLFCKGNSLRTEIILKVINYSLPLKDLVKINEENYKEESYKEENYKGENYKGENKEENYKEESYKEKEKSRRYYNNQKGSTNNKRKTYYNKRQ